MLRVLAQKVGTLQAAVKGAETQSPFLCTPLTSFLDSGRMQPTKFRQMTLLAYANLE